MIRWGDGLEPRDLVWVFPDKLAACEIPGGHGAQRRDVRLREEIIWIRKQNFTAVLPLVQDAPTIEAYTSMRIPYFEIPLQELPTLPVMKELCAELERRLEEGQKLLMHRYSHDEVLMGLVGCYFIWKGLITSAAIAEEAILRLFDRQLGLRGRQTLVELADWRQKNPPKAESD